jgi:hypothetical protein
MHEFLPTDGRLYLYERKKVSEVEERFDCRHTSPAASEGQSVQTFTYPLVFPHRRCVVGL